MKSTAIVPVLPSAVTQHKHTQNAEWLVHNVFRGVAGREDHFAVALVWSHALNVLISSWSTFDEFLENVSWFSFFCREFKARTLQCEARHSKWGCSEVLLQKCTLLQAKTLVQT